MTATGTDTREHGHYFKDVSGLQTIDVYRVLELWNVTHPALQHALKKVLAAGQRGAKDDAKDVQEAIDSLTRWQEMQKECVAPWPKPVLSDAQMDRYRGMSNAAQMGNAYPVNPGEYFRK